MPRSPAPEPALPIALSCGEPAGVGPELAVKAWQALGDQLPFFLIGDPKHLPAGSPVAHIQSPAETAAACRHGLPVLAHPFPAPARPGQPDNANAQAVIDVIARAVELTTKGEAGALCTNPINKKVLHDGAGFSYPGHTEFLAALAGDAKVVMMLACDMLRVVPTTIHIALREVPQALSAPLLEQTIRITHAALRRDFAIENPRLALCGLNPHAGEGGAMGHEEMQWITPLADKLRAEGLKISGPLPADTMFHPAARTQYDAAIAMYHDQALIPIKTLAFDDGVNVTLGLPFVRTSPDHGTAFDIAGKGIARPNSLIAALRMANDISRRRIS